MNSTSPRKVFEGPFKANDMSKRYNFFALVHLILWMLIVIFVYKNIMLPALITDKQFGITQTSTHTIIIDFPSLFNTAKELWLSKTVQISSSSVYSVENHLNFTSKWLGNNSPYALPFCYSPTMFWLLAPLVFFSHASAFCIFNIIGLWSIWWQTRPLRCRNGFGLLSFISPISYACMQLGQTALFTGACLLFIAENTKVDSKDTNFKREIYAGIALWILTAKPPLALTAGAVLISLRKWRPLVFALILSFFTTLLISPLLGTNWVDDYLSIIYNFNMIDTDKAFAFTYVPTMSNLRAILSIDFHVADNLASRLSSIMWLSSLLWMITAGAKLKLQEAAYWALGILFYLLFCPHVSSTEELQLVLLLPLCIPVMQEKLNPRELALFALIPLLPFISPVGPFFLDIRWGLFAAKLLLAIFIVYHYWRSRSLNAETLTGKLMAI